MVHLIIGLLLLLLFQPGNALRGAVVLDARAASARSSRLVALSSSEVEKAMQALEDDAEQQMRTAQILIGVSVAGAIAASMIMATDGAPDNPAVDASAPVAEQRSRAAEEQAAATEAVPLEANVETAAQQTLNQRAEALKAEARWAAAEARELRKQAMEASTAAVGAR